MEPRKLQKTGGTTYVVSLPKKWVTNHDLDQGSVVSVREQRDGSILVTPGENSKKELKKYTVDTGKNLNRKLIEKYLLGYDIVTIKSDKNLSEEQKAKIKKTLQVLVGFEIVEESANSLTVQFLLNPSEVSITKSLRRMYTIVSVMHRDLISSLKTGGKSVLNDVIQRDNEVNRLYFLVVRQIRTAIQNPQLTEKENIKAVDCVDYRLVSKIIEQIGDALRRLSGEMLDIPLTEIRSLQPSLEQSYEIHQLAFKGILNKDESLAIEAQNLHKKLAPATMQGKHKRKLVTEILHIAKLGKDLSNIVVSE
jgi:phosphate uptake regulator